MFWQLITRLGEAQILLPATLLAACVLAARRERWRMVAAWLSMWGLAVVITLGTKLAFMGWGLGLPKLNFSGISGHTMMATALYPILLASLVPTSAAAIRWFALATGLVMALLIGISRVVVEAHSWSEVLAGLAVGGAVTAGVLMGYGLPQGLSRLSASATMAVVLTMVLWLTMMPAFGPAFNSHSMVTQWSLQLSGRPTPYTRQDMLRAYRYP